MSDLWVSSWLFYFDWWASYKETFRSQSKKNKSFQTREMSKTNVNVKVHTEKRNLELGKGLTTLSMLKVWGSPAFQTSKRKIGKYFFCLEGLQSFLF